MMRHFLILILQFCLLEIEAMSYVQRLKIEGQINLKALRALPYEVKMSHCQFQTFKYNLPVIKSMVALVSTFSLVTLYQGRNMVYPGPTDPYFLTVILIPEPHFPKNFDP